MKQLVKEIHKSDLLMPHIIGYLRVSKESNSTGSYTFETQKQRIIEYLDRKYGVGKYKITFLEDDGLSGGYGLTATTRESKVRPTLRTIADMLETGNYAGVIVYGQSRFFRNMRGLAEMVEEVLLPSKVPLMSATEEIDIFTADGRMMLYMKGLFDEKQREDIIKRNKDAAASRVEAGYVIGQVCYGWIWEPLSNIKGRRRNVIPVAEEGQWIIWMKDNYLSGRSLAWIADQLNQLEVPTPLQRDIWSEKAKKQRSKNGVEPKWTVSTVGDLLSSPLHAGLVKKQSDELIQGQHFHQRFFEPEEHDAILAAMKERSRRYKTCSSSHKMVRILSGIIFCARCRRRLNARNSNESSKVYASYECHNGRKEGRRTCPEVSVRAQWVEDAVVEEIAKLANTPRMQGLLQKEVRQAVGKQNVQMDKEISQLEKILDQYGVKFDRWAKSYVDGTINENQFKNFNEKMEKERAELQVRFDELHQVRENEVGRERTVTRIRDQMLTFSQIWDELENEEKREVLSLLIEEGKLTVDRVGRDILLKIKIHFLPECERTIIYRTFQGVNRTKATPLQRLTQRQMVLLYYAGQGKDRKECAELMGCKLSSIYSIEKTIRRNLGGLSWNEAIDMSRDRVEANVAQLPLGESGRKTKEVIPSKQFLSPVLLEVLELFAKGATVLEVSERLGLSPVTVQGRRSRILKLMGTPSILEAAEKAKEWGILAG
jgi:DNA invertase Pin-like site-specific DNA recombinase/DNA-binding NarL/FixJ family response regulator